MAVIGYIIIGGLAGWIAEKVMKADHGLLTNIVLGIIGAFIGGFLLGLLGIEGAGGSFSWYSLISATLGAIILIWGYRAIKGAT